LLRQGRSLKKDLVYEFAADARLSGEDRTLDLCEGKSVKTSVRHKKKGVMCYENEHNKTDR
jgi:hypothetical protein